MHHLSQNPPLLPIKSQPQVNDNVTTTVNRPLIRPLFVPPHAKVPRHVLRHRILSLDALTTPLVCLLSSRLHTLRPGQVTLHL